MGCTDIRIKLLVDNKSSCGLLEEHGFSAWIEVSDHRILFDTGQGKALVPNAAMLGCDLNRVDMLVLSHGHYDHGGAVSQVLGIAPTTRVFCHSGSFLPRYSIRQGETPRTISMPLSNIEAILDLPTNQVHWVTAPLHIIPDVGLSGTIPRIHSREDTGGPFFLDPEGHRPDLIKDDMAMWMVTDSGLLITGCCHSGLINTVEHIRRFSGGGYATQERLKETYNALLEWNPDFVIPCHCTGADMPGLS